MLVSDVPFYRAKPFGKWFGIIAGWQFLFATKMNPVEVEGKNPIIYTCNCLNCEKHESALFF